MTNSLRERRKQMLRDEILDAARKLLGEKGYATMSMDELATEVGISKPTLYSHFATKDELVAATIIRELDRLTVMTQAADPAQTPLQRLAALLHAVIEAQGGGNYNRAAFRPWMPELHRVLCAHSSAVESFQRFDAAIVTLVHAALDLGEIDPALDPAIVIRAFFGLISSVGFAPPHQNGISNPANTAEMLTMLFVRGVSPSVRTSNT